MASSPPKLAIAAVLLVALWVIAYWLTPAPGTQGVKISFAGGPREAPRQSAPPPVRTPEPLAVLSPEAHEPRVTEPTPDAAPDATREPESPSIVPPTYRLYTTQPGDTFQRIAAEFYNTSASWRTIAKANPTVDPNRLGPGIKLYIPVDPTNIQGKPASEVTGMPPPRQHESEFTEYVVQRGDTLSEIAKSLYGRSSLWQRIVDANPGVDPDRLRPGTRLMIPPPPAPD